MLKSGRSVFLSFSLTIRNILIILLLVPFGLSAYSSNWRVLSPGGTVEESHGNTLGQTSNERVYGRSEASDGFYGFWYPGVVPGICFRVYPEAWEIDTVNFGETISMMEGDQIAIENCGYHSLCYGLQFLYCVPLDWDIGIEPNYNTFALRAHFTREVIAPSSYDPFLDYISGTLKWADTESYGISGAEVGVLAIRYLWFQFGSPTNSDLLGANVITIGLVARNFLP
ncbi:hypothetical protein JW877_01035 [bacterium]|nr:hypothetical protein [bacterium]